MAKFIVVVTLLLLSALPVVGQTSTTNCTSTATSDSTVSTNCSTQTQAPPPNPLQSFNDAMKQAQERAQARRALKLQEDALKQQKQSQDRDFALQALSQLEKDRETFAALPATNDPSVTASRTNLTESYNNIRTLACGADGQLVVPDIDGTPNSCQKMQDAKILKSVAGACEDYAAKHPEKAGGHEIKAWGNRHFTCVKQKDGGYIANEHP